MKRTYRCVIEMFSSVFYLQCVCAYFHNFLKTYCYICLILFKTYQVCMNHKPMWHIRSLCKHTALTITLLHCLPSMFWWTNETVNIWSHIFGWMLFLGLTLYDLLLLNIHASFSDKFIVGLLLVCFQVSGCTSYVCCMTLNNSVLSSLASSFVLLPQFLAKLVSISHYITSAVTPVAYLLLLLLL